MAGELTLRIRPTFRGFAVQADAVPTKLDPLGQLHTDEMFDRLEEAVDALPRLARIELARQGHLDDIKADSPGGTA
jgi:hypothetical protein